MEETSKTLAAMTPRVTRAWYVACLTRELEAGKLLVRRLHGAPVILFRGTDGTAAALLDRCPHRNVPISCGSVVEGTAQCGYHGWRFRTDGECVELPGYGGEASNASRRATAYPVREQQGLVWVWTDPEVAPDVEPFHVPHADDPDYLTVIRPMPTPGSLHMVIENALDVPHTAFLHGGLFRTDRPDRRPIRAVVTRFHDSVQCEFIGEERPKGLAARLLAPSGGELTHFDRFFMPSITQVEYRLGDDAHLLLHGACTPVDDFETIVYAVVCIRTRLPRWLVRQVVQPVALKIFNQDRVILRMQKDTLHTFKEARFASTDLDVLGLHILRLMTRASRGEAADPAAEPFVREVTMWV